MDLDMGFRVFNLCLDVIIAYLAWKIYQNTKNED